MILGELCITDKRIVEFTYHKMILPICNRRAEANLVIIKSDSKNQLNAKSDVPCRKRIVAYGDGLAVTVDFRLLRTTCNLDFFLFRRIIIQSPQKFSSGIILTGSYIAKRHEITFLIN